MKPDGAVKVREAVEDDVERVRDIFRAVYGPDYPYQRFYDTHWLKKSIFSDDILTLVAEADAGVIGTASVVYSAGARADFISGIALFDDITMLHAREIKRF